MQRQNIEIGGTEGYPIILYPLRFDGWLAEGENESSQLVASINDRTVTIPLDDLDRLIKYLQRWVPSE